MIVKTFLVGTMTSLNLAIMPRSIGANELVLDSEFIEKFVYCVNLALSRSFGIRELRAIVRLDYLREITEVNKGSFEEVYRGESAMFFVGIDEPLSRCLINRRVLK